MNQQKARRIVKARSNGVCEICGGSQATDMHHRRNRSQGGQWAPENLMHLCHPHHMHITTHPAQAREQGWSVPSWADPATTLVWIYAREYVLLTPNGDYQAEEAA